MTPGRRRRMKTSFAVAGETAMSTATFAEAKLSLSIPLCSAPSKHNGEVALSPERQAKWKRVLDEIERLGRLENDWDGQGALAIDPKNVDRVRLWVVEMSRWQNALPPRHVVPGTAGEIVLKWCLDSMHLA